MATSAELLKMQQDLAEELDCQIRDLEPHDSIDIEVPYEQLPNGIPIYVDAAVIRCESSSNHFQIKVVAKSSHHVIHEDCTGGVDAAFIISETGKLLDIIQQPFNKFNGSFGELTMGDKLRLVAKGDSEVKGYGDCIVCMVQTKIKTRCYPKGHFMCIECMSKVNKDECPMRCTSYIGYQNKESTPFRLLCNCCRT